MSEHLNLPESLERLEINSKRGETFKTDHQAVFPSPNIINDPECSLKTLSLKAECTKDNCQCNKKRNREKTLKRVAFKRPILRRSKLSPGVLLRAPVLRINNDVKPFMLQQSTLGSGLCSNGSAMGCESLSAPNCDLKSRCKLSCIDRLSESGDVDDGLPSSSGVSMVGQTSSHGLASTSSSGGGMVGANGGSPDSCSVQARRAASSSATSSPPDDTTIDELASYFDILVHIPKKMSLMAEMMYI